MGTGRKLRIDTYIHIAASFPFVLRHGQETMGVDELDIISLKKKSWGGAHVTSWGEKRKKTFEVFRMGCGSNK